MSTTDKLQERIGEVMDAKYMAESLLADLDGKGIDLLDDVGHKAETIVSHLDCAETCETEKDFDANIKAAYADILVLADLIKASKKAAKEEQETAALDTLLEAESALRELTKEVKSLLPGE